MAVNAFVIDVIEPRKMIVSAVVMAPRENDCGLREMVVSAFVIKPGKMIVSAVLMVPKER